MNQIHKRKNTNDTLKTFKRVKLLLALKFQKSNAFSAIALDGTIFEKLQPIGV